MTGNCKLGDLCRFAHGEGELRVAPQNQQNNNSHNNQSYMGHAQQQYHRGGQMQGGFHKKGGKFGGNTNRNPHQNDGGYGNAQMTYLNQGMNPKDAMIYQQAGMMPMMGIQQGGMNMVQAQNYMITQTPIAQGNLGMHGMGIGGLGAEGTY